MKIKDLLKLNNDIVLGNDASDLERFAAISLTREAVGGQASLTDAYYANGDVYVIADEVDGELQFLTWNSETIFLANKYDGSSPMYLGFAKHEAESCLDIYSTKFPNAKVMTLAEALTYEPAVSMKP